MDKKTDDTKKAATEEKSVEKKKPAPRKKKKEVKEPEVKKTLLDEFGDVKKNFILDNIRVIDYVDLAKLVDVKPDELKKAVEEMGIKLPIDRSMKWNDLDVGEFKSLKMCARCQVHLNHDSFLVDILDCRKCLEANIKLWVERNMPINLEIKRY